jgi:hypothetical protein
VVATWFNDKIITPVKNAFKAACDAIAGFFSNLWTGIKRGIVGAMNAVIGGIESAINFIVGGINKIIGGFNKVVSWAAKIAEVDWGGVDLVPKVSISRIPQLAKGAVIPPNKEFMAILGDQKNGTNIEAPLDTIKQAVAEELAEYIDAMMTGFQAVVDAVNEKDFDVAIGDNAIGKAAERYNKRQALVRGTT